MKESGGSKLEGAVEEYIDIHVHRMIEEGGGGSSRRGEVEILIRKK